MPMRLYNGPAEAACNAMVDTVDAGAGAGRVEIRSGAQPAINGPLTGNLLAEFTLNATAYGNAAANGTRARASGGGLPKIDPDAAATGTAGYGAIVDSDGNVKWTDDVGTTGSGAGFEIDNLSIVLDQEVQLVALNFDQQQIGV